MDRRRKNGEGERRAVEDRALQVGDGRVSGGDGGEAQRQQWN